MKTEELRVLIILFLCPARTTDYKFRNDFDDRLQLAVTSTLRFD